MTATVQQLAGEIARGIRTGADPKAFITRLAREHGRDVVVAAVEFVRQRSAAEKAERDAEYQHERADIVECMKIFADLPPGTRLLDACRIKAARGDALARKHLDRLTSPQALRWGALVDAAAELHPGWKRCGDGCWAKQDDAPAEHALVEWLYAHHPKVARRVEASFPLVTDA
jgi:hypothetical protein